MYTAFSLLVVQAGSSPIMWSRFRTAVPSILLKPGRPRVRLTNPGGGRLH